MSHEARPRRRVLLEVTHQAANSEFFRGTTSVVNWIFSGEILRVGRAQRVGQMSIESDTALSKQHFEISFDGIHCRLRDLQSANGTCVNGTRVDRIDVQHGDEITAGRTTFSVSIVGGEHESAEPVPIEHHDAVPALTDGSSDSAIAANVQEPATYRYAAIRVTEDSEGNELDRLSRMMAWLRAGQSITVGSSAEKSDWKLKFDDQLAPAHFRLEFDGQRCVIQRLDSLRPTLVNGDEVDRIVLQNDDKIKAGRTAFVVELA